MGLAIHLSKNQDCAMTPGIPAPIAATIAIASPPARREDAAFKLFFVVPSLAQAREAAARLGGGLAPIEQEWRLRNYLIAEGFDPEGNGIQLRQGTRVAA